MSTSYVPALSCARGRGVALRVHMSSVNRSFYVHLNHKIGNILYKFLEKGSKFETVLDFVDRAVLDYPYRFNIGTYSFSVKIHFNFLATQWKSRIGAFFMVF